MRSPVAGIAGAVRAVISRVTGLGSHLAQLRAAGFENKNIFREKITDTSADRPQLRKLIRPSPPGDVVTVTRIDRLASNVFDLFGFVERIVDAKAQARFLAEPWADTERLMLWYSASWRRGTRSHPDPRGERQVSRQGRKMPPDFAPQRATSQELPHSYDVGISIIRRTTRIA
jgi:hypothetical protein